MNDDNFFSLLCVGQEMSLQKLKEVLVKCEAETELFTKAIKNCDEYNTKTTIEIFREVINAGRQCLIDLCEEDTINTMGGTDQ